MLKLTSVHIQLGAHTALTDIDFSLDSGEMVGILGANGAGKSSLLATLAGDLVPSQGQATLDEKPLSNYSRLELARRRALLPQSTPMTFDLSVEEVIAMGASPWPDLSPVHLEELVTRCLNETDTAHLRGHRFPTLSGGEALRCHFARLMVQACAENIRKTYVLLDEPTANLDPYHQNLILETTRNLTRQRKIGVAISLHDVNLAARWCDRLVLLCTGKIVAEGVASTVLTPDNLAVIYNTAVHCQPHPLAPERPLILFG